MTEQNNQREKQLRNQRHWQAHVKALQQSGLSRAEYCRQHKLSYHALTYWQRKLSGSGSSGSTLVPVTISHGLSQAFPRSDRAALKVILPGRLSVEVGDTFSPATLLRLLTALENR
jgi:hypothetical protein